MVVDRNGWRTSLSGEERTGEAAISDSARQSSGLYQRLYAFQHAESDWEPEDGLQRTGATLVAGSTFRSPFRESTLSG